MHLLDTVLPCSLALPSVRWRGLWTAMLLLTGSMQAYAGSVPPGFNERQIATGMGSLTALAALDDGRVLVLQQNGVVRITRADAMLDTPFYRVENVDSRGERGCLGIVADPEFATNRHIYLYCTVQTADASHNRVLRVTAAGDTVAPGSERVILDLPDIRPNNLIHMGGALRFGTDRKLYVAVGNHENSVQRTNPNSQNLGNPFGKMLRINPDGTIPSDNPFYRTPDAYRAIYLLGLREPFTFDFQPETGLMFIGDVGEVTWEEVNRGEPGGNYGWPMVEGFGTDPRFINPVYAYPHRGGCAVVGSGFYNPATPQFPASFIGKFLFADYCNGTIRYFDPNNVGTPADLVTGIRRARNLAVSNDGSLYYIAAFPAVGSPPSGGGSLFKVTYTGSQAPRITAHPQSTTVLAGEPVTFSVAADAANSYQWQRNGFDLDNATGSSYTLDRTAVPDTGSRFRVVVRNAQGSITSDEATLTVTTNRAPTARITSPGAGSGFATGDVIRFAGEGTDPEDGALAGSAFTWQIDLQHDVHAHPLLEPTSGSATGSFTVTDFEANEANSWLRLMLTVRDSSGQEATASRDIYPRTSVSSLSPVGTPVNGWGPYEVDRSNGEDGASPDGRTITLAGIPYARGLGVHAPSDLRFALGGVCSGRFISDVGIDDEVGDRGSVNFRVLVDGVPVYESGVVTGSELRRSVNVSVAGAQELRLLVDPATGSKSFDHADWAGARVTGCNPEPSPPARIDNLQVADGAHSANWSVQANLQADNLRYGDRPYTFRTLPGSLVGANWIRTANESKHYAGSPLATFSLSAPANVYIAFDNRLPLPGWIDDSWTDTGENLETTEGEFTLASSVFRKRFEAGTVTLGPQPGVVSLYTVIVK